MSGRTISEIISSKSYKERKELLNLKRLNAEQKSEMKKCGTLCWKCKNASQSGCSWFKKDRPVNDWVAEPTFSVGCGHSYMVYDCPKYVPFSNEKRNLQSYNKRTKCKRNEMRNLITTM